jgi:hypothetical protein
MKTALAALAALAFLIVSCNKVENNEIDQILAGKGKKPAAPATTTETKPTTSGAISDMKGAGWEDAKVKEVQKLVTDGAYDAAIGKIGASTDPYMRYYLGIIHYFKMLENTKYSVAARNEFNGKAVSILKEIGNGSRDELLAARSLIWSAMAVHIWRTDLPGNEEALATFQTVIEKYKDTEVANAAILYAAKVNQKIGRYDKARALYNRLSGESFKSGLVWDPHLGRWFSNKDAAAIGLERVRQLTTPGWRPPQAQQSSAPAPAPAATTQEPAAQPAASSSSSSTAPASSTPAGSSTSSSTSSTPAEQPASSNSNTTAASTQPAASDSTTTTTTTTNNASNTTTTTTTTTTAPASDSGASSNSAPATNP